MIDHIGIDVSNVDSSKEFYKAALMPLGYELAMEFDGLVGFGASGEPDFWIHQEKGTTSKVHVAFRSTNRAVVREFYKAALKAGGKDNGVPGIREIYHPNYYGAFVLDPDGHNIEAVCHDPESEA
jgi:catechol 2,3-dioxygenase-like lactoylglutathione lyase family enzyme